MASNNVGSADNQEWPMNFSGTLLANDVPYFLIGERCIDAAPVTIEAGATHFLVSGGEMAQREKLMWSLISQKMRSGQGLVWFCQHHEGDNVARFSALAAALGRADDVRVLSLHKRQKSHSYNGIGQGSPTVIADRLINYVDAVRLSCWSVVERECLRETLVTLVAALRKVNRAFGVIDLVGLMQYQHHQWRLATELAVVAPHSDEYRCMLTYLTDFGGKKSVRDHLCLPAMLLQSFLTQCQCPTPDIQFDQVILDNTLLVVDIPPTGNEASQYVPLLLDDLYQNALRLYKGGVSTDSLTIFVESSEFLYSLLVRIAVESQTVNLQVVLALYRYDLPFRVLQPNAAALLSMFKHQLLLRQDIGVMAEGMATGCNAAGGNGVLPQSLSQAIAQLEPNQAILYQPGKSNDYIDVMLDEPMDGMSAGYERISVMSGLDLNNKSSPQHLPLYPNEATVGVGRLC